MRASLPGRDCTTRTDRYSYRYSSKEVSCVEARRSKSTSALAGPFLVMRALIGTQTTLIATQQSAHSSKADLGDILHGGLFSEHTGSFQTMFFHS